MEIYLISNRSDLGRMIQSLFLVILLAGCAGNQPKAAALTPATPAAPAALSTGTAPPDSCPVSGATWAIPPEDSAVLDPPAYGYYLVNEDQTIWASAWWAGNEDNPIHAGKAGNKVGWFRPAGAALEITGRRLDAEAPPLEADIPCCYPTRFQATGLVFPTGGCWEVHAKAADSTLTFVLNVEP